MDKKHTPSNQTPRVPSTVPNDYDHLPAPGSLNIPLANKSRRRPQARRRGRLPGWAKALLAVGGAAVAFGLVALVIGIIVFPPFFRNLEPRYQQRIIDIVPLATYLKPTVPFEVLPTLGGSENDMAAQDLLLTPQDTDTPSPTTTGSPQPTAQTTLEEGSDGGGIPVGVVNTPVPTLLPTYEPPTPLPEQAVQPTWTPVSQSPAAVASLPSTVRLTGIRYESQGWNNCGPTTMTMALSYFGWSDLQYTAARWMKPHTEDKNVSPWQMVRFVNENTGVKALYRIGGTTQTLKRILAAGFPVVIEQGLQLSGEAWMGHYLLLIGYDDIAQNFLAFDSFLGSNQEQGRPHRYSDFDENWRHFNRIFIVVYEPSREIELRDALGDYADPNYGYRAALETARTEAAKNIDDKWAWFNMGTAYAALGEYENASLAYDRALQLNLPWRMLWYQFGPYESYFKVGRYNDVLSLAETNRSITPYVEETYYWEGMVYAAEGQTDQAVRLFNEALRFNKNYFPAEEAKSQVESGTFQVANVSTG